MRKHINTLWIPVALSVIGGSPLPPAAPQVVIVPGAIRIDATFQHLSALWWVEGDEDLDSFFSLEFRLAGQEPWEMAASGMRAYPSLQVGGEPLGLNYWAASALFLEPGQVYELRLSISDPDGGGATQVVTATTRIYPAPDPSGRQLYVSPGSGGGDGSPANPFLGLSTAAQAAIPGDTFLIAPGTYSPFQILSSGTPGHPITFKGPGDGTAVIDGAGTDRGVVTLGEYNQTIRHVILDGLTLQNGRWGVDAQHSQDITVQHNLIQDVDDGIVNRRGDALEANQTVCDNTIIGRTPWPGIGIPSAEGIELHGTGNVVCHNRVQSFGDCISVDPSTGPSFSNDVYGNDVSYCVDDGIEVDYNQANVRVWRNRVMNARMGVSLQPIRGGPAYVFRNEFFNLESVPVKMHNDTTGFYVIHNTGVKHGNGFGDNGAMWRNAVLRNNLFLGTRYAFEFTTNGDEGFRDFDYGAWGTSRMIDPGGPFFKWDNVRYDALADLPPGVEDHGVEVTFGDLISASLPPDWNLAAEPGSQDLGLSAGSPAINSGETISNLNQPFVLDGLPDRGAFEVGLPLPVYGPRPRLPDLTPSNKLPDVFAPRMGEALTYTITIRNIGAALMSPLSLTDTVPNGLEYIPGSLTATSGIPDDSAPPLLRWTGDLGAQPLATVSYAASVTTHLPQAITNQVTLAAGPDLQLTRRATVIVNGWALFLPLLTRTP